MTDPAELEALLQRAVAIELKTAATEAALAGRDLTVDAREDLAAQARETYDGELSDELVADLEAGLAAVEEQWQEATGAAPGEHAWDDVDFDDPKGMDFDEPDDLEGSETKGFGGCLGCGSTEVDELVSGERQCSDCGLPSGMKADPGLEHKDFDEPDDPAGVESPSLADDLGVDLSLEPDVVVAADEAKSLLSEGDLLRRQRLGL